MRAAGERLRGSAALRKLLGTTLALGNRLNAGSYRAGAEGFKTECLSRLAELRTNGTQGSLLQYAVSTLAAAPTAAAVGAWGAEISEQLDGVTSPNPSPNPGSNPTPTNPNPTPTNPNPTPTNPNPTPTKPNPTPTIPNPTPGPNPTPTPNQVKRAAKLSPGEMTDDVARFAAGLATIQVTLTLTPNPNPNPNPNPSLATIQVTLTLSPNPSPHLATIQVTLNPKPQP